MYCSGVNVLLMHTVLMYCSGPNCSTDISECLSRPCFNNAQCLEPLINMYLCLCPVGITGRNCEVVLYATFPGTGFIQVQPDGRPAAVMAAASLVRKKRQEISGSLGSDKGVISFGFSLTTTVPNGIIIFALGVS